MDKMLLPDKENMVITHYGCSDFKLEEHEVFWLGAIYYECGEKRYFFAGNELDEADRIRRYYSFLNKQKDKVIIHWSMNTIKFGFIPIERRYEYLTNSSINCLSIPKMDLSEFLKNKYGTNYIEKDGSRLNHLAKLNGFTGFSKQTEVKTISDASDRLELLFSIIETEINGTLKVNENSINKINPITAHIYESLKVYWIADKRTVLDKIEEISHHLDSDGTWMLIATKLARLIKEWSDSNIISTNVRDMTEMHQDILNAFNHKEEDRGFSYTNMNENIK